MRFLKSKKRDWFIKAEALSGSCPRCPWEKPVVHSNGTKTVIISNGSNPSKQGKMKWLIAIIMQSLQVVSKAKRTVRTFIGITHATYRKAASDRVVEKKITWPSQWLIPPYSWGYERSAKWNEQCIISLKSPIQQHTFQSPAEMMQLEEKGRWRESDPAIRAR